SVYSGILRRLDLSGNLAKRELVECLEGNGPDRNLFDAADAVLRSRVGPAVYLRGLVEISNRCRKNCFYCGLRRDNSSISRYTIPFEEITACLESGYSKGLRSFLLQSGELLGEKHIELIEGVLKWSMFNLPDVKMVLSVGELHFEEYDRMLHAGAHRYLLRIETSSPELYSKYHPPDEIHSYQERLKDIEYLRNSGWQAGTGVLIGLPGQTEEDLANDLLFMRYIDIDMIGMGPYIENRETPLWDRRNELPSIDDRILLTLRMIALARMLMPSVNIAATTALQTVSSDGLERGLMAGANVVMPNLTPPAYRDNYNLYHGKTFVGDTFKEIIEDLDHRSRSNDRMIDISNPGDPLHFSDRMKVQQEDSNERY
ncbi:MAG: [FeFe] hydrogenase H-cluster radical SAM maturase HydE, partial [Candidatus Aegiribacteria sp.]|nr:[FeFe] hydrogenase H-cluster radical SAM maturase HydE [Candidatus Aegiribacteria sp.]